MLEINEKQLLSYDNVNRARILKYIALGIIKFKGEWSTNEYNNIYDKIQKLQTNARAFKWET